jgi:type I restriction enzyme R subunit
MYFATYQAIAKDENRPGLYKEFGPDFFDLVIVDECHRGSANDESNWRDILTYFKPSFQLGMTATPLRNDNRDTYLYFGNPVYTYSLRQGIEDGFLAPYRVHRIVSTYDATGWRPSLEDLDRYGRQIPDELYQTGDFERIVALRARTEAIAQHLTNFLKNTDRFAKTIVFCVDQEHALAMRAALINLNSDLVQRYPDYVCRVTAAEGEFGRAHLGRFQEPDTTSPVILTTSQLLTTGVDAPTCKNIVLARVINSMTDFKQIIGRGTRVREDYNKLFFNILDYTGSATRLFADPEFDGEPARITEEEMNNAGETVPGTEKIEEPPQPDTETGVVEPALTDEEETPRRKYYFDGGQVEIAAHMVYELDPEGKQLRVVKFTDYTGDKVRTLYPSVFDLRRHWSDPGQRTAVIRALEQRGIALDELRKESKHEDADPFDLLCHIAFNSPLRSRRDRAETLKKNRKDFFQHYAPEARAVLEDLLEKYAQYGTAEFELPETLQVPPISARGTVSEITAFFGGPQNLRNAVNELQTLLYAP